ncbi:MAG: hypothetical protein AABZ39_02525 [Spirochaetota bacterium]|mgnify:CR=1 FL=1
MPSQSDAKTVLPDMNAAHIAFIKGLTKLLATVAPAQAGYACIAAFLIRNSDDALRTNARSRLVKEFPSERFHIDRVIEDIAHYLLNYTDPYERLCAVHALQYGLASSVRLPEEVPVDTLQSLLAVFMKILREQVSAVLWANAKFTALSLTDEHELKSIVADLLCMKSTDGTRALLDDKKLSPADLEVLEKNILVRDMVLWWTRESTMQELLGILQSYKQAFVRIKDTVGLEQAGRTWGDEHGVQAAIKMIICDATDAKSTAPLSGMSPFDVDENIEFPVQVPDRAPTAAKEIDLAAVSFDEFKTTVDEELSRITDMHIQLSKQVDTTVAHKVLNAQLDYVAQLNKYCTKDKQKFMYKTILYGRLNTNRQIFRTMDRLLKSNRTTLISGLTMEDTDHIIETYGSLFLRQSSTSVLLKDFFSESDLAELKNDQRLSGNRRVWDRIEAAYFQSMTQKVNYTKSTEDLAKLFYNRLLKEKNPVDNDSLGLISHYGLFFPDKIRECVNLILLKREKVGFDIPFAVRTATGFDDDEGVKKLRELLKR